MSGPAEKAKNLLDIAVATYAEEIAPALPKDKRYVGAMIASALGAAQRRLSHGDADAACPRPWRTGLRRLEERGGPRGIVACGRHGNRLEKPVVDRVLDARKTHVAAEQRSQRRIVQQ